MPTTVASDLYASTLQTLVDTRNVMITSDWVRNLHAQPHDIQLQAQMQAFNVEHAIQVLSNAQLSDIAADMAGEDADIKAATTQLNRSLADITQVQTILGGVTEVLAVVAKVVSLA